MDEVVVGPKMKILVILGIIVVLISSCVVEKTGTSEQLAQPTAQQSIGEIKTGQEIKKFKLCEQDTDCVSVGDGCCGCNNGGTNTAINKIFRTEKIYIKEYNEYSEKKFNCAGIMCPKVISNHWSCTATPKCVDGICQLIR